jgi:hypothetical protein
MLIITAFEEVFLQMTLVSRAIASKTDLGRQPESLLKNRCGSGVIVRLTNRVYTEIYPTQNYNPHTPKLALSCGKERQRQVKF